MTDFPLFGTIVNTVAVLIGAASGLVIRRFAARCGGKEATVQEGRKGFSDALMRAMGLCVILIGIMGALSISNVLLMIVSMALGTVLGELLDLDGWGTMSVDWDLDLWVQQCGDISIACFSILFSSCRLC